MWRCSWLAVERRSGNRGTKKAERAHVLRVFLGVVPPAETGALLFPASVFRLLLWNFLGTIAARAHGLVDLPVEAKPGGPWPVSQARARARASSRPHATFDIRPKHSPSPKQAEKRAHLLGRLGPLISGVARCCGCTCSHPTAHFTAGHPHQNQNEV